MASAFRHFSSVVQVRLLAIFLEVPFHRSLIPESHVGYSVFVNKGRRNRKLTTLRVLVIGLWSHRAKNNAAQ